MINIDFEEIKRDAIESAIAEDWSDSDKVSAWNEYCDKSNYTDDIIFSMWDFDDLMSGRKPSEILDLVGSNFSAHDEYFAFDGYGNLISGDSPDDFDFYDEDAVIDRIIKDGASDFPDLDEDIIQDDFIAAMVETTNFTEEEINAALDDMNRFMVYYDLIMDDWSDIAEKVAKYIEGNDEE